MFMLLFGEDQADNIPKENDDTTKNLGERMYLDRSSIRYESLSGKRH